MDETWTGGACGVTSPTNAGAAGTSPAPPTDAISSRRDATSTTDATSPSVANAGEGASRRAVRPMTKTNSSPTKTKRRASPRWSRFWPRRDARMWRSARADAAEAALARAVSQRNAEKNEGDSAADSAPSQALRAALRLTLRAMAELEAARPATRRALDALERA
jgi:ABC-type branched-subunit amino acid transport system substrate-binding protein